MKSIHTLAPLVAIAGSLALSAPISPAAAPAPDRTILPIDDRSIERVNPATAGRPDLMQGRTSITLAEGMIGMSENVFLNIKNKSKTITSVVEAIGAERKSKFNGRIPTLTVEVK
jgi:hypothetical protein